MLHNTVLIVVVWTSAVVDVVVDVEHGGVYGKGEGGGASSIFALWSRAGTISVVVSVVFL